MANRKIQNVLCALLLLACIAAYTRLNGSPLAGPELTAATKLVVVEPCPMSLPTQEKQLEVFLWEHFMEDQKSDQGLAAFTTSGWLAHFRTFSEALVVRAEEQKMDGRALQQVLEKIQDDAGDQLAYLPIRAEQAEMGQSSVWVVVVRWEGSQGGPSPLSHIRVFVFDRKSLQQVGFATCS